MSLDKGRPLSTSHISNAIARHGGLPPYVRELTRGLMESGMTESHAIASALHSIKVWAAGGDNVKPDTRAKSIKAWAEWLALLARIHASSEANKAVK